MYLLQSIYPLALASVNMATGWFLYHLSESILGGLFVLTGLLVILALIGSSFSEHGPILNSL
jgi:hypothetical protein